MPGRAGPVLSRAARPKARIKVTVIPNGCAVPRTAHAMTARGTDAAFPAGGPAQDAACRVRSRLRIPGRTALVFPSHLETGRGSIKHRQIREGAAMDDDSLLDELQEDLGSDYSPQLRVAAGMLSGDAQAAVPYLLFSIAKSLEDISFLLANDSVSVVMETDEDE
jgi:hypothetical protein